MNHPNRLAREGEELVVYRFPIGSLGLASPVDVEHRVTRRCVPQPGVWSRLKAFLNPPKTAPVCAVCIPPGAHLRLDEIPPALQHEFRVSPTEEVTFTQTSAAVNTYRDAVRFSSGLEVRLQSLFPGQRVVVLDLGGAGPEFLDQLRLDRAEPDLYAAIRRG
jgi:hypothetical protein